MPISINDVLADPEKRSSLAHRFSTKVRVLGPKACWPWTAKARHHFGYGAINSGRGNLFNSHVVAYALRYGPIPIGAYILHSCDNPGCCNPAHLRIGTKDDNTDDVVARKRLAGKTGPVDTAKCAKKLNIRMAREIKASSLPRRELASMYGVSKHSIANVQAGRTYPSA